MWASEAQLADNFEGYLRRRGEKLQRRGKGAVVLREYEPGYGRVDMVWVVYDMDRLLERRKRNPSSLELRQLDKYSASAMSYLTHSRWVSLNRLGVAMNLGPTQTRRLVSNLEHSGLVETHAELVKTCTKRRNFVIDYIETFELKLENWQRALEQAGRHLWFASRSYVVLPDLSERVTRRLVRNCIQWNIGAILLQATDNWKTIRSPLGTRVPTSHVGWLLNEWIVSKGEYA